MSAFAALSYHRASDQLVAFDFEDDVTGWTFKFYLLASPDSATTLLELTSGAGVTVTDAAGGLVEVYLSSANLDRAPDRYYWALARTDSGAKDVKAEGTLTVLPPKVF